MNEPLDRELRQKIQDGARSELAGWEFTPAMRQAVLNRIAAEEAAGVTTTAAPAGGKVAARRIGWRPIYAALAAAAAVAVFYVVMGGANMGRMQKAAPDQYLAAEPAPQAAMPEAAAGEPERLRQGKYADGQAPAQEPAPAPAAMAQEGDAAAAASSTKEAAQPAGGAAVAGIEEPSMTSQSGPGMDFSVMDAGGQMPRSAQPSLVIIASGQSGDEGYRPGDTVRVDVTLRPGTEQAWDGPIAVRARVDMPDGTRVSLAPQPASWNTGLPAGEGSLTAVVAWDQAGSGGARAPAGEYTLHVQAEAAGGQTSEGNVIIHLAPQ